MALQTSISITVEDVEEETANNDVFVADMCNNTTDDSSHGDCNENVAANSGGGASKEIRYVYLCAKCNDHIAAGKIQYACLTIRAKSY